MTWTLTRLADTVGGTLRGDGALQIGAIASVASAGEGDLTFATTPATLATFVLSTATAAIVPIGSAVDGRAVIEHANPTAGIARAAAALYPEPEPEPGIHELACVHETAVIGSRVSIGPFVRIGARTQIEDDVRIADGVSIGEGCRIGSGSRIDANATLYGRVTIGRSCRIFSGAVLGAPGFGYTRDGGTHRFIPQVGGVVLGDFVDVGACSCIDSGTFSPTRVDSHVKIDDLVMIGHNCSVGERSLLCGQAGLAGSVTLGEDVVLGGKAGVSNGTRVDRQSAIAASSSAMRDVPARTVVAGVPAIEVTAWRRATVTWTSLPDLRMRIRHLERRIAELEGMPDPLTSQPPVR
jgi:UDP-3-O-[3-hydroxymyristoyl] glucosamine N-acyltransferase